MPPARAGGLPGGRGVVVTRVTDHGAADQAGLKVGDIILRIGKAAVRSQPDVDAGAGRLQARRHAPDAGAALWLRFLDGIFAQIAVRG